MRLDRLLLKAGAATASIVLSMYLWNHPLPGAQFWTLNIVDLTFTVTALAIPVQAIDAPSEIRTLLGRLHVASRKRGLDSHHGRAA